MDKNGEFYTFTEVLRTFRITRKQLEEFMRIKQFPVFRAVKGGQKFHRIDIENLSIDGQPIRRRDENLVMAKKEAGDILATLRKCLKLCNPGVVAQVSLRCEIDAAIARLEQQ